MGNDSETIECQLNFYCVLEGIATDRYILVQFVLHMQYMYIFTNIFSKKQRESVVGKAASESMVGANEYKNKGIIVQVTANRIVD